MNKNNCQKIVAMILNEDNAFSQTIAEHCSSCQECKALRDNWSNLRDVKLETLSSIPANLEKSILEQAVVSRKQVKRLFLVKHIFQYTALAAAVCIGFIAITDRIELTKKSLSNSASGYEWSWETLDNALLDLQKDVERSSGNNSSSTGLTHVDLNIDTVIDGINYYEVML